MGYRVIGDEGLAADHGAVDAREDTRYRRISIPCHPDRLGQPQPVEDVRRELRLIEQELHHLSEAIATGGDVPPW